ncbi:hypothetical protein HMPREF1146_0089 [Prevotella sp. MSX73]|nr:hypothetical protein HMPREF1146_0089 [Prevotella sp. MSX73]
MRRASRERERATGGIGCGGRQKAFPAVPSCQTICPFSASLPAIFTTGSPPGRKRVILVMVLKR